MDIIENFDNICINSKDCIEGKNQSNHCNNYTETSGKIYVDHFLNEHRKSLEKLIEESSEEDDEVTFIRQISTPLLNHEKGHTWLQKRKYLQNQHKIIKSIKICFILSLILALFTIGLLIFLPSTKIFMIKEKLFDFFKRANPKVEEIIGCDHLSTEDVWVRSYPRMLSEGAIRLIKIDNDDILDMVIPFGTNVVKSDVSHFVCSIYYPGQKRCFGGLLALNGKNGDILWRYDSTGEMYALTCSEDLNKDGWIDCVGAGRVGTLAAVSGRDGTELWAFDKNPERNSIMNLYTPQFIDDIDGDGIRDIVDIHGGDPVAKPSEMNRLIAKIIAFSGRTGHIIVSKTVSDSRESYYSPQLLNAGDGVKSILYGTGGETFPGNMFLGSLQRLLYYRRERKLYSQKIYQGTRKGVMTPPVLVDLNSDGREDIVICPFGDICMAIDGLTLLNIWTFNFINNSETYASPAAGFYNEDDVPDIFIQLFVGLGYPVYFYGETIILDGRNGTIIKKLSRSNNVVTTSPLTLSIEGKGNDIFLFWLQLCRGHENNVDETPFQNVPQYLLSRAHICKIRFNTTTQSIYVAHGRKLRNKSNKMFRIYNSDNYFHIQNDIKINASWQIYHYLTLHPELKELHQTYKNIMEKERKDSSIENDDEYAKDLRRKLYHKELLKGQNMKDDIDLNDANIHKSIDFETPSSDNNDSKDKDEEYIKDMLKDMQEEEQQIDDDQPLIRTKRHNGPHDGEGQQRLISTGTLAPPMLTDNHKDINQSMDVIFSTYWSTAKEILLQTKNEIKCNKNWIDKEYQRFKPDSKFYHYDHDHYSEYGNKYCTRKYGRRIPPTKSEKGITIFNNHAGQLTVFRKRLKCTCSSTLLKPNQRCAHVLPFHFQTWPAYLGLYGTGYWNSTYYNLLKV